MCQTVDGHPKKKLLRKQWDEKLFEFLKKRSQITKRPMVWSGDLNVAHTYHDSTNEDFFRNEWDRDSNRHASKESYFRETPPEDRGIPGFSDNERKRFEKLLEAGDLFDSWRHLNPITNETNVSPESNAFTWRGTPAVQNNFRARYEGMGQRLDYHLLSNSMSDHLVDCKILGHGTQRHGFLGSDHCPVILQLKL
mmetsp:Transcript_10099/g.11652  ORF Transcript_10099/g.11652 Transcript_10099/m.11652 type:complete len:195 (-) Transcript_10099:1002-1586(-)